MDQPQKESPNVTVIRGSEDYPIIDVNGNVWRITKERHVTVDGFPDHHHTPVLQLAYVNRMIWRQTEDLLWFAKAHPTSEWLPEDGTMTSPIASTNDLSFAELLATVKQLRADFALSVATASQLSNGLGMKIDQLRADFDTTLVTLQRSTEEILAGIRMLTKPTRIVLDIENGTSVSQPVPSRDGP